MTRHATAKRHPWDLPTNVVGGDPSRRRPVASRRPFTDPRVSLLGTEPVAVGAIVTAWRAVGLALGIREEPDPDVIAALAFTVTGSDGPWATSDALRILDTLEADARSRRLRWRVAFTTSGAPVLALDPMGRVDNLRDVLAQLEAIGRDRADAELAATAAAWSAEGFNQGAIGRRLGVSDRTVRRLLRRRVPRLVGRAA